MKRKTLMMVAALMIVGLVAGAAWAGQWGGGRGGGQQGCGWADGAGAGCGFGPMSQAFADDTADLRKQLAGKRGQYHALMAGQNPDPGQAGQLRQEMFEIREQLRAKAREHNVPFGYGGRGSDGSTGYNKMGHHRPCRR